MFWFFLFFTSRSLAFRQSYRSIFRFFLFRGFLVGFSPYQVVLSVLVRRDVHESCVLARHLQVLDLTYVQAVI